MLALFIYLKHSYYHANNGTTRFLFSCISGDNTDPSV